MKMKDKKKKKKPKKGTKMCKSHGKKDCPCEGY
jgi:hypothetical protein